jgi:hypothetical protein
MGFSDHFNCAGHDSLGFDGMFDPQNEYFLNLNTFENSLD